jgi:FkbM family methyltransferase
MGDAMKPGGLWRRLRGRGGIADPLAGKGVRAFSQEGEDLLLKRIFQDQQTGFYVDVGAHHPVLFSNTLLLYLRGWRGINMDAMPGSMELFRQMRPLDINIECGVSDREGDLTYYCFDHPALNTFDPRTVDAFSEHGIRPVSERTVHVRPLADLLAEALPDPRPLDVMSIDVEGFEMNVLISNNWQMYRPRILVVEKHVTTAAEAVSSDLSHYLETQGYGLIAKTLNTLFFCENEFLQELRKAL